MNIFRFMADMLHLTAICILLYRIRKSRNCIGKCLQYPLTPFRSLLQNSGNLPDRVHDEIHGSVHVLHFSLQHLDEAILHLFDCFHHLSDEIQKAILHSK